MKNEWATFQRYIISIKDAGDGYTTVYEKNDIFNGYNTLKFGTIGAAIAYARAKGLNPFDFEIRLVEFKTRVVSRYELNYDSSSLGLPK